jgi:probable FeS assembly SUF system protein SufT
MRPGREPVRVRRPVRALQVPSGKAVELEPGQAGVLTQALGGSYTIYVDGALWRIDGCDGDAIGQPVRTATERPGDPSDGQLREWVWEELGEVYDPEIPCSIVELGLVYRCEMAPLEDGRWGIDVKMTVTAPGCGMGEQLGNEVADRLLALPRVGEVRVDIVFDPPWDRSMMSDAARLSLGLL